MNTQNGSPQPQKTRPFVSTVMPASIIDALNLKPKTAVQSAAAKPVDEMAAQQSRASDALELISGM